MAYRDDYLAGIRLRALADLEGERIRGETARETARTGAESAERRTELGTPGALVYSGIPGKFRRVAGPEGGREPQAFSRAVLASKTLGAETSYGGQAPLRPEEVARSEALVESGQQAFSRPIPVIRGMTTTYQGPRVGEEFSTEGQGLQAFRRNQGAPFIGPHEQKMEEIAAQGKSQEAGMAQDLMTRKRNREAFVNRIESDPRFYKEGPEGLVPIIPGIGQIAKGFLAMGEADPEKAFKAFEAQATRHLDEAKWINDQGVTKAIDNLMKAGYTLTPGQKAWLASPRDNPQEEKKRRDTLLQWVNPTAIPGGTSPAPEPAPAPATAGPAPLSMGQLSFTGPRAPAQLPSSPPAPALLAGPQAYNLMGQSMQAEDQRKQLAALKRRLAPLSRELERNF